MFFGLFGGDNKELNLIPEEQQKSRGRRIKALITLVSLAIVGASLLLYFFILGLYQFERINKSKLEKDYSAKLAEWQQVASLAASVKTVKTKLASYESFKNTNPEFNLKVNKLLNALPEGVQIKSLSTKNSGDTDLEGRVQKASVMYQLFNVLNEQKENFDNVKLEGVSLIGGGFDFIISLKIK